MLMFFFPSIAKFFRPHLSNYFHVRVWSVATLECITLLKGHTNHVMRVKFAPHVEDMVASASCDGSCRLWGARTHRFFQKIHHFFCVFEYLLLEDVDLGSTFAVRRECHVIYSILKTPMSA